MKIKAQKNYPENVRWEAADVVFSAFQVIGSNNGRAAPNKGETPVETASRKAEWAASDAANLKWLDKTFDESPGSPNWPRGSAARSS